MLHFEYSKLIATTERAVATGATITAEGSALVWNAVGGGVQPSSGAANELFAGVSFAQQLTPLALPQYDSLVCVANGANYQVTTTFPIIAGTLRVYDVTTSTVQTAGSPASANQYSVTVATGVILLNSAELGHTIAVSYRYAPTTAQALAVQGNTPPGGAAALLLNSVGVVTMGDCVTTEFDTTQDWTTVTYATAITLGAGGLFTIGGSGTTLKGAYITMLPTATVPFLGVHFAV